MMIRERKRLWAMLLSAALIVTQLPAVARAEDSAPEDGSIASFEPFDSGVADQTVAVGTELSGLRLPATVTATVYHVAVDTMSPDKDHAEEENGDSSGESVSGNSTGDSSADSGKTVTTVTTSTEEIPVTWGEAQPAYDGGIEGTYVFTADAGGYPLSSNAVLPRITVTVTADTGGKPAAAPPSEPLPCTKTKGCTLPDGHEGECVPAPPANGSLVKTVAGWTFVDDDFLNEGELALPGVSIDNQADFDTVVSMLPTQIRVSIEGETDPATLDIDGWICPEYIQAGGSWPLTGDYVFTAALPAGFACGTLPTVKVTLGGTSVMTINDRFSAGGLRYKELGPDTVQLIGYDGTNPSGALTIPSSVTKPSNGKAYTVVSIGDSAFKDCSGFTGDLTLPDTLTHIGNLAFQDCSGFTGDLTLPDTLSYIGEAVFDGCSGFTGGLTLPDSLTYIGGIAFQNCSGFTGDLTLPNTLTFIGVAAFSGCSGFSGGLTLPDNLSSIGNLAFYGCSGFSGSLTLPDTLTYIGNYAFYGCSGFSGSLTLPDTLTHIGDYAFYGCSGFSVYHTSSRTVADLLFHSGIEKDKIQVQHGAYTPPSQPQSTKFSQNGMQYEITGPNTVTLTRYLQPAAATGSLTIPGTVTENAVSYTVTAIGDYAFSGCSGFSGSLTLPDNLTHIEDYAFSRCSGFSGGLALPDNLTYIGDYAFSRCSGFSGGLALPDNLTYLGDSAFSGCSGFSGGLALPDTLTYIDSSAFYGCSGFSGGLALPDTLTYIDSSAFYGCSGFSGGLSLPDNLTYIGNYAFSSCSGFSGGLSLPDNLTYIGVFAFSGCSGLTSAHLGNNLQELGINAFPPSLPLFAGSPRVQLLINEYLNHDTIADTSWDGAEDVPDGAIAAVKQDAVVSGSKRIGREAEITVADGVTLTVNGTLMVNGTLRIYGILTGSGTLYIGKGGKVEGDISGIRVEYPEDMDEAKKRMENHSNPYSEPQPQSSCTATGDSISRTISLSDLKKLADSGKSLTLRCDKAAMTFKPAALKAILAAVPPTAGSLTFAASPADLSAFPDAAKLVGAHPVYDFIISYKDGKGNPLTVPINFPAGSASISLNYTPAAEEVTGSLFMVYADGGGTMTWLDKSSYNAGRLLAEVPHFSTYGVAYRTPAPVFTDVKNHWAKEDIAFAAARGLLSGTGNGLFSPDGIITRGVFVTALGRLAGVNPDSYQTRSFTDVKADASYAAYVEWAAQKNIVKGTGDRLFSPDAPVTREQMAVMMASCAGQMGFSIPTPLAAAAFADKDKISPWAAKEVAAMQRAGIVKGKDGNRFDPQTSATRAEVSAALRRFVEIVIDPATAGGWVKNDSGHRLYYQGGKALTGWQTIGKLRYYFNSDGVMHEGWKQDTATNKWYFWTNAGAVTGWREIDGKLYYFDANGVMAVNTKVDGHEVGPDGARKANSLS